jgi:eukaryotic-like serine/threonine-protein kinase
LWTLWGGQSCPQPAFQPARKCRDNSPQPRKRRLRASVLLLGTEFGESLARFSPDGRWVAYQSNESGRIEVYVRPFVASGSSGPSFGEGKWQVSKKQMGVPTQLFSAPANGGWDMIAEGKRFLMLVSPVQQTTQTPISVVLNWAADLKQQPH